MKPTLVVLAAGMGSRYGGLKQIDTLGPSGQAILQYSCFDAARAGFGKVVFVIRRDIEKDKICREHNLQLIRVENTYARRYNYMKDILLSYFAIKH